VQEDSYEQQLHQIIRSNTWFMAVLRTVYDCALPDWFVGGGIIRNITWDFLHGYNRPTPVADVDVAFYDSTDLRRERDQAVQQQLCNHSSDVPWEATNQAAVHLWYEQVFGYAVAPLRSSEEAIRTWPETVTSIGVRLLANEALVIVAPFGLDDLFQIVLRRNPCRVSLEQFRQRVQEKNIQQKWPRVRVIDG
jgi:uncharacterized protein